MKKKLFRYSILVAAVSFLLIGFYRDELTIVWEKAAHICLECIGIG